MWYTCICSADATHVSALQNLPCVFRPWRTMCQYSKHQIHHGLCIKKLNYVARKFSIMIDTISADFYSWKRIYKMGKCFVHWDISCGGFSYLDLPIHCMLAYSLYLHTHHLHTYTCILPLTLFDIHRWISATQSVMLLKAQTYTRVYMAFKWFSERSLRNAFENHTNKKTSIRLMPLRPPFIVPSKASECSSFKRNRKSRTASAGGVMVPSFRLSEWIEGRQMLREHAWARSFWTSWMNTK